jgi:hypothetical protein
MRVCPQAQCLRSMIMASSPPCMLTAIVMWCPGLAVLTKWTGRYSDYREIYGFRVPTDVEVTWELENGSFTYARFQLITLEYNISERF